MPGLEVSTRRSPKSALQRGRPSVYILWRWDLRPITLRTPERCVDGRDQAHLVPRTQAVSAHPGACRTAELQHLDCTNFGTDDAEGPINHYPAWRLVRIGT